MAKARASRLSAQDWIQAGYAILAEEGIKALKLDRLCARLDVTKGSFNWHFSDMASYRAALIDAWGQVRDEDRRHFATLSDLPPRERLSQMMDALLSAHHWMLERAMREWARTDDAVAAGVRASDVRVLAAVRQAFVDEGFAAEEAEVRAVAPAARRNDRRTGHLGVHRTVGAGPVRRPAGAASVDFRSGTPHGARLCVERLDDRLLRLAQLDARVVRRARPIGSVRDAAVSGPCSPGADGPRGSRRSRDQTDRPVVVGHRRDGRRRGTTRRQHLSLADGARIGAAGGDARARSAERVAEIYAERLSARVLAYEGVMQKDKPLAQARLGEAHVRLRALRGLLAETVGEIESMVAAGDPVPRPIRGAARMAAAHIVHESRQVIAMLLEASGASAHRLDNPLQRIKRDVDVMAGHAVFDYDTSRELAGALELGMKVSRTAMV